MQAPTQTAEFYVKEIHKKQGVTVEVETDCITYDEKTGMILQWELYSSAFMSWMPLDLNVIQNTWPSKFIKIQDEIDQLINENKRDEKGIA